MRVKEMLSLVALASGVIYLIFSQFSTIPKDFVLVSSDVFWFVLVILFLYFILEKGLSYQVSEYKKLKKRKVMVQLRKNNSIRTFVCYSVLILTALAFFIIYFPSSATPKELFQPRKKLYIVIHIEAKEIKVPTLIYPRGTPKPLVSTRVPEIELTKEHVIWAINKHLYGGVLTDKGAKFYKAYEEHGVSAMLMAAIAYFESRVYLKDVGWVAGLSKNSFKLNNFNGMNRRTGFEHSGRYTKYPSIDVAIDDMGYWIRYRYLDGNNALNLKCKNIKDIGKIYCPLDDVDNGKNGMDNSKWVPTVTRKFEAIKKDAERGKPNE